MTKIKILCEQNFLGCDLDKIASAVEQTLEQDCPICIGLNIVSEQEIRETNSQFRGVDSVTDVLSFPMLDGIKGKKLNLSDHPYDIDDQLNAIFLGDILICENRAKEQAEEYGHSVEREFTYLLVHGILHLFGYDHLEEGDKTEMRNLEEKVMSLLGVER